MFGEFTKFVVLKWKERSFHLLEWCVVKTETRYGEGGEAYLRRAIIVLSFVLTLVRERF